jgi:hypothetical protein
VAAAITTGTFIARSRSATASRQTRTTDASVSGSSSRVRKPSKKIREIRDFAKSEKRINTKTRRARRRKRTKYKTNRRDQQNVRDIRVTASRRSVERPARRAAAPPTDAARRGVKYLRASSCLRALRVFVLRTPVEAVEVEVLRGILKIGSRSPDILLKIRGVAASPR